MKRSLALLVLGACISHELPPTGQLLLYFDTDAPLSAAPGVASAPNDPAPLFDTLRVDVFEPDATAPCPLCTREFGVDTGTFRGLRASIGVPQRAGVKGYRVRARLYRAAAAFDGQPPSWGTIDVTVATPPTALEGIIEQTIFLPTEAVGAPEGTAAAPLVSADDAGRIILSFGRPAPSRVGTWSGAVPTDCTAAPPVGEEVQCIRGGAYWMGNPRVLAARGDTTTTRHEWLVVVSPFYLMRHEVTVADAVRHSFGPPDLAAYSPSASTPFHWCTYNHPLTTKGDRALNCVVRSGAAGYCQALNGDLPTEAEWEFASSGRAGHAYVWGEDDPSCDDAWWGHPAAPLNGNVVGPCEKGSLPDLPAAPSKRGRDCLGGDCENGVVDLAGNVSEWTRDNYETIEAPCWSAAGVYSDPLCVEKNSTLFTVRGGAWTDNALFAALRGELNEGIISVRTGFRCAWPGQ